MGHTRDLFGEIAAGRTFVQKKELHTPTPMDIPETILPFSDDPSQIEIRSPERPNNAEELDVALSALRQRMQPFLADCSPELPSKRHRIELDQFDWRIETETDRKDMPNLFRGEGEWRRVSIPHYGEPIGKAATYYRTTFVSPVVADTERVFLHFDGVDYKTHVFVNGYYVGSHEGFFAPFEFDITPHLRQDGNILLVRVENDYIFMGNDDPPSADGTPGAMHQGDKLYAATGVGYDDPLHGWHHCPPGMGIYQRVYLETRPSVHITDIFVRPQPDKGGAEVWLEIRNCRIEELPIRIDYALYGKNFDRCIIASQSYSPVIVEQHSESDVDHGARREIPLPLGPGINYIRFPMSIDSPRLWETHEPWLYQLHVTLADSEGAPLDYAESQFGFRTFSIDENGDPKGSLLFNGRRIKLRGANTMGNFQQDVFKGDVGQLVDDILLAKLCNMNYLRITQRPVQKTIYDYCDRLGLMTQTDLPLFGVLRRNQFDEAIRQAGEMEKLVRSHPCNILVSYINEAFPNARNQPHRHLQRNELDAWIEAANRSVRHQNPDRMIKPHDGDYDPPEPGLPDHHCYCGWYNGHGLGIGKLHRGYWQSVKKGWNYGCGEFGSEGLDPVQLMRKRYPVSWLPASVREEEHWSPNSIVKSQTGRYHYMWFDTRDTLESWVSASHDHQARMTRIMTEAFRRDPRMVSYAIHLFIDAFPSGWMKAIMDVNRDPKPAYFAYRNACEPVMISLRTDRLSVSEDETIRIEVWIANDPDTEFSGTVSYGVSLNNIVENTNPSYLAAGETGIRIAPISTGCIGSIEFRAPRSSVRRTISVHGAIRDNFGKPIDESVIDISVFPHSNIDRSRSVAVLGDREGHASKLVEELDTANMLSIAHSPDDHADLILLNSIADYHLNRSYIDRMIREGACAVFLNVEEGTHEIADGKIRIDHTGMREFFFVSRNTGHELVANYQEHDFSLWYDPSLDYIAPILDSIVRCEGWKPILTSGIVSWGAEGGPAGAAIEREYGNGIFRVSQLSLAGRTINPVARSFALRLLGLGR